MRSTVSIKGMALALVIFFVGASLLCYLFLYRPKISKVIKGTREIASLNGKVEKAEQHLKKVQEAIEKANKEEVNVDYFKRYRIPPEQRTPTFLEMVNAVVNRLGIKTTMVKPMPEEETPEYIRYPFLVETKSKYEEIAKFVDSLENSLGLNLDDLNIQNDPKDPLWHRLKFTVSTFELKEAESSPPPETPEQQGPRILPEVRDNISITRDPFLEKEKKKEFRRPRIPKRKLKGPPPLKLKATMDFGGNKWALVDDGTGEDTSVREGDRVTARKGRRKAEYRILEILENELIADYRGEKYVFKLEPLLQTKKPSVKTQKR